jgi:hypothetical protein
MGAVRLNLVLAIIHVVIKPVQKVTSYRG